MKLRADGGRPDIVWLKALYRFLRDEGYPAKQQWWPLLPAADPAATATGQDAGTGLGGSQPLFDADAIFLSDAARARWPQPTLRLIMAHDQPHHFQTRQLSPRPHHPRRLGRESQSVPRLVQRAEDRRLARADSH